MSAKEDFEFMNSELWLKYTHARYLGEEEVRHRVQHDKGPGKWDDIWQKIMNMRKVGAVPMFLKSLDMKFWYFPSDSINKKISEVERLGTKLYDKINANNTFIQSFLVDAEVEEAISSAIYEGANTTRAKAKQLLESGKRPASKDDWMLLNNVEALEWIKAHRSDPVSLDLILKIHQIVTKNTLSGPDANYCGKFRDDSVVVNNAQGKIVHEGINYEKIEETLSETIKSVTAHPRYLHPLIRGILLHYFVAYIHPFFDGNGRTARTLFYFKSMKHDLKFVELLSISAHLKNSGNQYEKAFEKVKSHDWDLTYFIDYSLESLLAALKIVEGKVEYLLKINVLAELYKLNENQIGLLQKLALNKYRVVTIEAYAAEIGKSREVARQDLKSLVQTNLLTEEKSGKKFIYQVDAKKLKDLVQTEVAKKN
jgi:Fic family protein